MTILLIKKLRKIREKYINKKSNLTLKIFCRLKNDDILFCGAD